MAEVRNDRPEIISKDKENVKIFFNPNVEVALAAITEAIKQPIYMDREVKYSNRLQNLYSRLKASGEFRETLSVATAIDIGGTIVSVPWGIDAEKYRVMLESALKVSNFINPEKFPEMEARLRTLDPMIGLDSIALQYFYPGYAVKVTSEQMFDFVTGLSDALDYIESKAKDEPDSDDDLF